MDETEMAERLRALRNAFLMHIHAVDLTLRGHADVVAAVIGSNLDQMSESTRASHYGMELQDLRTECLKVAVARARLGLDE